MPLVAVHLGAGVHPQRSHALYESLCRAACTLGMAHFTSSPHDALSATRAVCMFLEDAPLINAGTGSNLTVRGTVECDASVMSTGHARGAAVGAVAGVKNPVALACEVLSASYEPTRFGRVAPLVLVGDGATAFAMERGMQLATDTELTTPAALARYERWSRLLSEQSSAPDNNTSLNDDDDDDDIVTDTIGVICVSAQGDVVVAASSGGVALKLPGRIGPAAMLGSGIWAASTTTAARVAVCTTGTGEDIITTNLATSCVSALLRDDDEPSLGTVLSTQFATSPGLQSHSGTATSCAGVLAVRVDGTTARVMYAHTSATMCVGWQSSAAPNSATVVMSAACGLAEGGSGPQRVRPRT
ncbi:nucleophile aminohydrolase [Limtongia smithiae]|uniref:nucleophile aminohydrolase n=1 Tax=Limtongia smithiae TaxID=1125753 RepID=UPI0034CD9988